MFGAQYCSVVAPSGSRELEIYHKSEVDRCDSGFSASTQFARPIGEHRIAKVAGIAAGPPLKLDREGHCAIFWDAVG